MTEFSLVKAFVLSSDAEQAEFINKIARELFIVCGGRYKPGGQGYENQICYITRLLNKDGEAFIEDIYEFIQLRKKEIRP